MPLRKGIKQEPGFRAEGWEGRKPKAQGADSQAITLSKAQMKAPLSSRDVILSPEPNLLDFFRRDKLF